MCQTNDHIFAPGEHALDRRGRPVPGYALNALVRYERSRVRAAPWRLKEWDFYQIADERLCLQLVIGHVSYAGNCNAALFDHAAGTRIFEQGVTTALPFRSMGMPESARADSRLAFDRGGARLSFETRGNIRYLSARVGKLEADVTLVPEVPASVTVCMPFARANEFYLNEKVNLLRAERIDVRVDGVSYAFDPERTFSLLDWGRGVWPFTHEWYWSSASALLDGAPFGFNLGCGFGDASRARGTENTVYIGREIVKLGRVAFETEADPMRPWRIASDDGRFEAVLSPCCDRDTATKLLFVDNRCHQMFGTFAGRVVTGGGAVVPFADVRGFAEHAINRW